MPKRGATARQKLFNIDLETLLISDFSPDGQNYSQTSGSETCKLPKKLKTKDNNSPIVNTTITTTEEPKNDQQELNEDENEGNEEVYDVSKFFENVGNDFNKSLRVRKSRLGQFTDAVMSIHQTKITELIKNQETEIQELKDQTVNNIEKELNKYQEDFKKLVQQEQKLMKILEQQTKMVQKTAEIHVGWVEHFRKLHQDFIQAFEALRNKHKNETHDLKKSLEVDMSDLQNKFLIDSKKEEMQTMKKYLNSIYF